MYAGRQETSFSPTEPTQGSYCSFKQQQSCQVLLAMTIIKVTDSQATEQPCGIVLDGGLQQATVLKPLISV
jgi:hypothetical protein